MTLPVVDLGSPSAPSEIDRACRDVGFFYVRGHGVPHSLMATLDREARAFFAEPAAVKERVAMTHAGRAWRGWFPLGGELTSGEPDMKEGIYFGAELPADPDDPRPMHGPNLFPSPSLRAAVLAYMEVMTDLGQRILAAMAAGLGLPDSWFVDHLTADPLVLFRIFRYPPAPAGTSWGVAEHTDYGLLTILGQDPTGGLEVRTSSGWLDAPPLPGTFVCNIGDMLERLTGGRYRSTPHRVRNESTEDRLSFPFFLDPAWDAVVDRLPIVERPGDDGSAARWDHASVHGYVGTYGEYITAKVAKVFPELASP